jgi:hypothetical protein
MTVSLTPLARQAQSKLLARILCVGCAGIGGDPHASDCPFCKASPSGWCNQHRCTICAGRGVVCPECRGMRFHSSGHGDMVHTMTTKPNYQQSINNAVKHCPKCMHLIDNKATLSLIREDDVIIAYIRDPHNAYWAVRDEQDRQRAEWEALTREAKPWRRDWGKQKKLARTTAPDADELLTTLQGVVWPKVLHETSGITVEAD